VIEFPAVEPGEPVKVSAGTYVAYLQCPEAAAARLEGHYSPDSVASFRGALAHRVFARALGQGPIEPGDLERVVREEIGIGLNQKMGPLQMKPSKLAPIIEDVGRLYERFRRFPSDGFAGAEVALDVEPRPGVRLIGKIDAVFVEGGGRKIVDWKTGELGDPLDQLRFYALVWALSEGELPVRLEAVSVLTGERLDSVPTAGDIERVAAVTAELISSVRRKWRGDEELARLGGPWCRYCPLLSDCPEGRAATELTG
jgi:hypothetical protein